VTNDTAIAQNKEYRDGLSNAQIVQAGLLPKKRHFERLFDDHFVCYFPQDVISGDFYWVGRRHNLRYLVVGDCTGHGISASLLSVLGLNLFEYAIMNKGIKKPSKILKEVDKKFIESFRESSGDNFDNPWIDLSIICIDDKAQKIQFASANRKMLHVSLDGEPTIYLGSRYPIGGWQVERNRTFETTTFAFKKGETIFLGSDGFQDQMGGPKNKKYKSKKLHEFLIENSHLPFLQQKQKLQQEFTAWKHDNPQTDDVCLIGVKL
jgi:sigma-B regulation protein RsbU (phosphoserine phosphatase)